MPFLEKGMNFIPIRRLKSTDGSHCPVLDQSSSLVIIFKLWFCLLFWCNILLSFSLRIPTNKIVLLLSLRSVFMVPPPIRGHTKTCFSYNLLALWAESISGCSGKGGRNPHDGDFEPDKVFGFLHVLRDWSRNPGASTQNTLFNRTVKFSFNRYISWEMGKKILLRLNFVFKNSWPLNQGFFYKHWVNVHVSPVWTGLCNHVSIAGISVSVSRCLKSQRETVIPTILVPKLSQNFTPCFVFLCWIGFFVRVFF